MRQTVGILGTPIDILDTQGVLERLEQFQREQRFHQVATANTDFLINGISDPELSYILRNADLVVPDGMPVVWASAMMRAPLPERVTGADLVPMMAELAAKKGYRVYMLGGAPEVAAIARDTLVGLYPGLQIVGCCSPPLTSLLDMDHEAILADINKAHPDILLVAFGNPKQEKWIHMHRDRLSSVPICIGVGGTFDFIAGLTPRAPRWMQKTGLEWSYRLSRDPRRLWRRYARDLWLFLRYVLPQWWTLTHGRPAGKGEIYAMQAEECTILSIIGDFDAHILPQFASMAEDAFRAHMHLVLDFQGVTAFDAKALGTLINLPKRAALLQREVRLISLPPAIQTALERSQVGDGLYVVAGSVAEAFVGPAAIGLGWQVQSGATAAVISLTGSSEPKRVGQLERACRELLDAGVRLDLIAHGLTYADTRLITALYQLTRRYDVVDGKLADPETARFRIIPGYTLLKALERIKSTDKLVICDAPNVPQGSMQIVTDMPDALRPSSNSGLAYLPMAAFSPRAR